jgi:CubicO group peptidase (beta-lactamase class C family)
MSGAIRSEELDGFVDEWLARTGTLGAAVAIVDRGAAVDERGVGRRRSAAPDEVDAETVFPLASISKTFTAGLLASLLEDGRVTLEDRVVDLVPEARFADEHVTELATLADLASHSSGLMRHPLAEYEGDFTREELLGLVRHVPAAHPFRTGYSYTNLTYLVLGTALGRSAGAEWADLVRTRLLEPLRMGRSFARFDEAMAAGNLADPHNLIDQTHEPTPRLDRTRHAPASVVHSCARDMGRWLELHAGGGSVDGAALYPRSFSHLLRPYSTALEPGAGLDTARDPMAPFWHTSLAWGLWVYRGELVLSHGGAVDGFKTDSVVVPARGVGCAVMTNTRGSTFGSALCGWVLDRALGGESVDWLAKVKRDETAVPPVVDAALGVPGAEALHAHAGRYLHPGFGELTLQPRPAGLGLAFERARRWPLILQPDGDGGIAIVEDTGPSLGEWGTPDLRATFADRTLTLDRLGTWTRTA